MIASLADGLTSFYGGFVIFAVVGFMAKEANVTVEEVATEGNFSNLSLYFITLIQASTVIPLYTAQLRTPSMLAI